MEKRLKKGFTLIELMVVIAIIGILATTLAPKLREQLAKAKDSKAVALLGASRTIVSSIIINYTINDNSSQGTTGEIKGDQILRELDITTKGLIDTKGNIIVGGNKNKNIMSYGGIVNLSVKTSKLYLVPYANQASYSSVSIENGNDLVLYGSKDDTRSTEGKKWLDY